MKKILLTLIILFSIASVSASAVSFNFDTTQNQVSGNLGIIYSNSIVFQITTSSQVLCRYSSTSGTLFESMEGIFEDNFETIHKKTFTNLHDGVYRYYVRCRSIDDLSNTSDGVSELEAMFRISNPISAQISLDDSPLSAGKYELNIITTKVPSSIPQLSYSYDGISYSPIILHGSGIVWKGFLIIPDSIGEEIGSFKFHATDLEGRAGSQILGENIFLADTRSPSSMNSIEVSGEYGQVKLEWFIEEREDIEKINIYRSEEPGVDLTNFYKEVDKDKEYYYDSDVSSGETYYYRIAPEDSAENLAELSRELKVTTLIDETSTSTTGLALNLHSLVDALLVELGLVEGDIERIEGIFSSKDATEKEQIETLGLTSSLQSSKSELNSLKRDIENYKLQDLTEEILNTRLSSSRVRMNILRKKVPDSLTKLDSETKEQAITEDTLRPALLIYIPELTPSRIDKSIEKSLELIEENGLRITSYLDSFEIIYLDGTKETKTLIRHSIDSTLERSAETKLLLKFPLGSLDAGEINMKNIDYSPEKENLISFETDVKEIIYSVSKRLDANTLNGISVSPVVVLEETTPLTGYFLSELPGAGSTSITLLILFATGLVGYLLYIKRKQRENVPVEFLEKARTVKNLHKQGKEDEANQLYGSLKLDYIGLSGEEKAKVFKEIKHLTKHKK